MIRVSQTFTKEKDQVNTLLEVEGNSLINKQKFVMKTEYIDRNTAPAKLKAKAYKQFNDAYCEIKELIDQNLTPRLVSGEYFFDFKNIISESSKNLFVHTCNIHYEFVIGEEEWGLEQAKIDLTELLYSYLYAMDDILDLLID